MRLVSFFFILILSASCGQDNSGGGSSASSRRGLCDLNGSSVECETIRGADGEGIDLLESVIEVPVKIENSDITFQADRSASEAGRRINCKTAVKNGEVYRFALRGEKLLMMTGDGSFEMNRLSDGEGLTGTWIWKGYVDQGTHIIRNMTFLSSNRVIMRTTCEL
jgi:hypothetical protein